MASVEEKEPVYLDADDKIRGQEYVCLSFLTPNRGLLREKQHFFISEFLQFFAMDYKIRATESFMSEQFRWLQQVLSDVELGLQNADVSAETAAITRKLSAELGVKRGELSRKSAADLEAHVKENLNHFKESDINEAYAKFMLVHRQRLEDEFHKQKSFQTTMHGLKVRGCYSTHEEAVMRAKRLNKNDPNFNVFVADVGQWLPWDPSPDEVEEQSYPEGTKEGDALNELMRAYKKNATESRELFEKEKEQAIAKAHQETDELKARVKLMSRGGVAGGGVAAGGSVSGGGVAESKSNDGDMFDGIADLAIQRRLERAAIASAASAATPVAPVAPVSEPTPVAELAPVSEPGVVSEPAPVSVTEPAPAPVE
jgi:hypothetical protein